MQKHPSLLCALLLFIFITACSLPRQEQPSAQVTAPVPEIVIDDVSVEVLEVGLEPAIQTVVQGHYIDSCTEISKGSGSITQVFEEGVFYISIQPEHLEDSDCTLPGGDFQRGIGLIYDLLPAGEYFVDVHGVRRPFVVEEDESIDWDTLNLITELVKETISTVYGIAEVSFVHVERVVWNDSCLNIQLTDQECTATKIPGYLFLAGDENQVWAYHSNSDGSVLLENPKGGAVKDSPGIPQEGIVVSVLPEHYSVNVRSGSGQNYPVAGQIEGTTSVLAVGVSEDGEWLQVVYQNDPQPYTLVWLYAPLTDYQPGANDLPVIPSDTLPAAEPDTETNELFGSVTEFILGLREQSTTDLESANLDRPVELLLLLRDDRMITPDLAHNALYHFSLEQGLRLVYSPPNGVVFDYCLSPGQDAIYLVLEQPSDETGGSYALYRLPLNGGETEWVADLPDNLAEVQLSPDGRDLLFLRQTEGVNYGLFKLGVNGQELTLFNLPGSVRSYAWSPDGSRIAASLANETGSTDIYMFDANGGNVRVVFERSGMDFVGGWNPDGTKLVLSHIENGNQEIFEVSMTTGSIVNLSNYTFDDHNPVWSPDGRFVAYQSQRFDSLSADSLMVWDTLTEKPINISRGIIHQTVSFQHWSPDSRYVLVSSEAGGETSHYIIDVFSQQAYLLLGDFLTETDDISNLRWVEDLQPAGASQSLGEYWLVPVSPDRVIPPVEGSGQGVLVTITEDMNVRGGPGIDYELVGELDIHTRLEVVGKSWDGYWLKISYPRLGADEAWIFSELTDFDQSTPLAVLPGPVIDISSQQALPD